MTLQEIAREIERLAIHLRSLRMHSQKDYGRKRLAHTLDAVACDLHEMQEEENRLDMEDRQR